MRPGTNLPLDDLILHFTCCPSRFLSVPGLKIPLTKSLVNLKIMAMLKASQKQAEFPKKVMQKTHPRVFLTHWFFWGESTTLRGLEMPGWGVGGHRQEDADRKGERKLHERRMAESIRQSQVKSLRRFKAPKGAASPPWAPSRWGKHPHLCLAYNVGNSEVQIWDQLHYDGSVWLGGIPRIYTKVLPPVFCAETSSVSWGEYLHRCRECLVYGRVK